MKKIISIALSVVMLIAVAMPVFAATGVVTINESSTSKTADVVVKTDITGVMPATGTYAVTIPADLTIAWDKTDATDVSYSVTSQLALGAKLNVAITSANANKLKETKKNVKTIDYTPADFAEKTFNEINNAAKSASTITVAKAAWDAAPVAEYADTLTYTVTYVPAT